MLMLDLCCGLKGASQAMQQRGWDVISVDINPDFKPDIVADLREWQWDGPRPDLIWCSPPCDGFAKFAMPCWYDPATLPQPDMSLVRACKRIIDDCKPRFWVIENVRGAVPFFRDILGQPTMIYKPYYLWGHFPDLGRLGGWRNKYNLSSSAKAERAKIPHQISNALAIVVEFQLPLLEMI